MEQRIADNAKKYRDLAEELAGMKTEQSIDDDIPEDVQAAFFRLYYAKAFEIEIEKCEDLLDEETDLETVNAVTEAADAISSAAESAYRAVEEYASRDTDFAERIDGITVSTEAEGLIGSLLKLYKCEGIIREAYRSSMKFMPYGAQAYAYWHKEEDAVAINAEDEISKRLGIDVYELLELRERLVNEIGAAIEEKKQV
jgi:hypothetical protein